MEKPLAPWIKSDSYAFPSGHMFGACVFYLWSSYEIKKSIFSILSVIIICGIAFGLVEQKYHDIYDILGALIFAILTMFLYNALTQQKTIQQNTESIVIVLLPISVIMMILTFKIYNHTLWAISGFICFGIVRVMHKKFILLYQSRSSKKS